MSLTIQAPSQDFQEGGYVDVCCVALACKTRGVWGRTPPGKFLKIRCFEIASEAILGQKQSDSSYLARRVLLLIFSLYMH